MMPAPAPMPKYVAQTILILRFSTGADSRRCLLKWTNTGSRYGGSDGRLSSKSPISLVQVSGWWRLRYRLQSQMAWWYVSDDAPSTAKPNIQNALVPMPPTIDYEGRAAAPSSSLGLWALKLAA